MVTRETIPASVLMASAVTLIARVAVADVVLPTGLVPGSQFEIAFVTNDPTNALSSDIGTYNDFVTQEAHQSSVLESLDVSWHAIASTATVNAILNAPNDGSIPVYNTAGQLVANSANPLYSGSLIWGINYTQTGALVGESTYIWTGTDSLESGTGIMGIADPSYPMGSTPVPACLPPCSETESFVITGLTGSQHPNSGWLDYGGTALTAYASFDVTTNDPNGVAEQYSLYALSSPITVPGSIPEPATVALFGVALLGLVVASTPRGEPPRRED